MIATRRSGKGDPSFPERIVELLPPEFVTVAATAGPVTAFADLAPALAEAGFVVEVAAATERSAPTRVWRSADLGVHGLLWHLREDPRLQSFVDAQLGAVLRLDDRLRGQMLETLFAYLEADGGMTAFAAAIGLSRPAAYARIARLRQVVGDDLDRPRTRLSLHLAMLALRQGQEFATSGTPSLRWT